MANAKLDDNSRQSLIAVSSADGSTPIRLYADPTTHRLLVDFATAGGTVTSVSVASANGFAGTVANPTTTPAITISTTINSPILAGNGTALIAATTTGSGSTAVLATSPTFGTSITGSYLTASEMLITDGSKNIVSAPVATYPSLTELSYVKGVTSAIQTQLNTKGTGNVTKVGTPVNNQVGVWTGDGTIEGDASLTFDTATDTLALSGNQTITVAAAANTRGLSIYQNDTTNDPLALQVGADAAKVTPETIVQYNDATNGFASDWSFNVQGNGYPVINLQSTGGTLGTPTASNIGTKSGIYTWAYNSTPAQKRISEIESELIDGTASSEDAYMYFSLITAGTLSTELVITGAALLPGANDGNSLGAAGTAFSDLFLAEGGVINWDSSDVTLTQTGNILAVAGGDLRVATADVGTNADSVPTISSTNTLTNKTLTAPTINAGTLSGIFTLAESTSIDLDPAQSDQTWTGITRTGTAGATLAFGQLCYLAVATSKWVLADADALATAGNVLLGMCVLAAAADGSATRMLLMGNIRADSQFPAMTIGAGLYVGETAGAVQVAIPTGADNIIRVVGFALTADELYFNPSQDWQVTVA